MAQNGVDVGSAAAAAASGDNSFVFKTSACAALGLAGLYYLLVGKRDKDLKCMLLGGALIFLSAMIF
jgi:hypothetical protein